MNRGIHPQHPGSKHCRYTPQRSCIYDSTGPIPNETNVRKLVQTENANEMANLHCKLLYKPVFANYKNKYSFKQCHIQHSVWCDFETTWTIWITSSFWHQWTQNTTTEHVLTLCSICSILWVSDFMNSHSQHLLKKRKKNMIACSVSVYSCVPVLPAMRTGCSWYSCAVEREQACHQQVTGPSVSVQGDHQVPGVTHITAEAPVQFFICHFTALSKFLAGTFCCSLRTQTRLSRHLC